ncbi:MAG: hypothetical protein M3P51_13990, partial [Chloroflexota bacterium]|nr:hypothetical protein [Chloroflexota bacterium]
PHTDRVAPAQNHAWRAAAPAAPRRPCAGELGRSAASTFTSRHVPGATVDFSGGTRQEEAATAATQQTSELLCADLVVVGDLSAVGGVDAWIGSMMELS